MALSLLILPAAAQGQISRPFTQRFPTTNTTGSITLIGNTLSTCNAAVANCLNARAGIGGTLNNDAFTSVDVDVDADGTTFNSSSATLTLAAGDSVMFAGLYWGAHSGNAARNQVLFQTPAAAYATITATQLDADGTDPNRYQGFRDVTALVRTGGSGNYVVANVQRELATNRYAGWALVVVIFNSSSLPRSLVVFDGYARVFTGVPVAIAVSGLNTPPAGAVNTQLGIIGYEGDLGITGDVLQLNGTTLSDAQNPANNPFNSSISRLGVRFTAKNPDYVNQLSFDADILDASNVLPNGATTATINLSSTGDQYYPGVVIFANELYSPTLSGSGSFDKTVVDVNGGSVMAGDTLEYTLTLTNTGLDSALSIVAVDTIPANASYAAGSLSFVTSVAGGPPVGAKTDASGDDVAEFSGASNRVVFRIGIGATAAAGGKLGPSQSSAIRFRVVIAPTAPMGAVVSNQGYVTYVGQSLGTNLTGVSDDPGSGGQQPTAVTVTAPDLSMAKSHAGNFTAGVAASYTLTVTNAGAAATFGTLTLIDSVPAGLTPTGASGAGWTCGIAGQVVTCTNPGPLAVSAASTVTVNVSVQAAAVPAVTNVARVATNGDGNAANDRATDPTTVGPGADLAVTKTDGVTAVNPGATLTYTIVASNAGPSAVTAATLTDTFDPAVFNVAAISWTCAASAGSSCPASGSGNLNAAVNLLSGGSATFTVSAPVLLSATGTITNTATITVPGGTTELAAGNNSATDNNTQITPGADLAMTKSDAPDPVNAGATVTYTLTATNNGSLAATDVTIADPTPASTTFLSATPSAGGSCSTPAVGATGVVSCVWTGATAAAAARSVTLVVTVNSGTASGTTITNTATASSATFDPVAGNNAASATTTVAVSADLGLAKVGPASVVPGTNVVYTLTVTNNGPSDAASVSVADVTPAGLTFVSNSGDCVTAFPCALGTVAAAAVRTITATFAVPAGYSGANPIVNAATVSSATTDPVAGNNTGTASTPVAAGSADLTLTKTGPASVTPGLTVTFTITVTNNGPSDAAGVAVADPTPAGLTFQSNAGDCVTAFPCALGTVAAAAVRTITATYLVPSGYSGANPILNTATVSAATSDPNAANNAQTASVAVNAGSADLAITKAGPASVTPGQNVGYTITLTNNGPSDAAAVSIADATPAGLTFVSNAGDCTSAFPCSLGTVPAGAVRTVTTTFLVPSGYAGANPIANTATATSTTGDPVAGNNSATASTPVNAASADLAITKVGPASVVPGTNLVYTLTITNNGPSDAASVSVADVTPAGLTFVSNAGNCATAFPCALGIVPAGAVRTITTTFAVPAGYSGANPIVNAATVSSPTADPVGANNTGTASTPVAAGQADLSLTKAGPASVTPGQTVAFTITVTNNGPSNAAGVSVTDATPAGLTFVSNAGDCTSAFPCALGTVAASGVRTITATYLVPSGYSGANPILNTATVGAATSDPNAGNNAQTASVAVNAGSADLAITKTGPASVTPGQNVVYTITLTNNGPSDAASVSIADATPAGLTFVSNAGDCVTAFPCALGTVTAGAVRTITTTFAVPSGYAGANPIVNTATASSSTGDPVAANNSGVASTPVNAASADVAITKAGPASVVPGTNLVYTLTITNNGPSDAASVSVADVTPAGLTFVSNAGNCVTAFPCALGTLTPGAVRTITTTFAVPAGYSGANPIVNAATVSSPTADPVGANNTGTASTPVSAGQADLSVTKTGPASVTPGQTAAFAITITNNGPSNAAGVSVADATPAGLTFVSTTGDCTTTFPCALGTVPAGAVRTITATYLVPSGYSGANPILNTASVTAATSDPAAGNNAQTASVAVNAASADVAITKTGPASVTPGQNVVYTITVTNNGPSDAASVSVADPTPAGLSFVSNAGACTTAFPCNLGTVAPGAVPTITTTFLVPSGYAGANPIVNTATASSPTGDPVAGNNSSAASTPVNAASADLGIAKVGPASVVPGQNVVYTITITNTGPSDAASVSVADVTPAGLTFVSNSGDCVAAFPCALGTVPAGAARTITATFAVPAGYSGANPILNTASASAATADPVAANNSATASTPLSAGQADLSLTKAGPAAVTPGQTLAFTIVVTNNGPSDAAGVSVADATPAGLTFVSNAGACLTAFPCNLGTVAASATRTITATYLVPAGYSGANPILNTASVTAATSDPVAGNNAQTASVAVNAASADLALTKTGPASVTPGQSVVYTITVTNNGPSDAASVAVADPTPAGLTFVSNSGACTGAFPCSLGTVPAGAARTITATFAVPSGYAGANPIVNTATVSSPTGDPVAGNQSGTASTPVNAASADVAIAKVGPASVVPGTNLVFTLTVTNNGPSDAAGVAVADPTPAGLSFVSNGGDCTTAFPCSLGTVPAGATRTITATFAVPSGYSGANPIVNTASVSVTTGDPVAANNTVSASTPVASGTADLSLTKSGPASVTPGQTLAFTIVVANNGPSDAAGVNVADATPAGLTFVATAGACTSAFPCALGTVPAGAVRTITATYQVPAAYSGANPILNTASVTSVTSDPNAGNEAQTVSVAVNAAAADLSLTKTGPASVTPGQTVVYAITVTNNGPSDAASVSVADATPAGLSLVSNAGACTSAFPCSLGTVPAGAVRTITTTFQVPSGYAGANPIVNTATVSSPTSDPVAGNESGTASTSVNPPSADLTITKTGPAGVAPGTNLTYTLVVTNAGPSNAQSVSVADPTPAGLTFVSASAPCAAGFPCALGALTAGAGVSITVTYAVPSSYAGANPIVNTATASATTADPAAGNNAATASTPVVSGTADLAMGMTGPASVVPGTNLVFTITATNNGPSDAAAVSVADATPAGLTFVSNAGACTTAFPCALGTVPSGATRTITTTYLVPSGYTGPDPIVNTASVTAATTDLNPGNDAATVSVPLAAASADLSISKVGPASVVPGLTVTYTITVSNAGPSDASGVAVADPTPSGLTFVSNAGDCTGAFPCSLATVAAGATSTITTTFSVPAGYAGPDPIVNTATVSSPTADPAAANNTASASTPLGSATADLAITKTGQASVVPGANLVYTVVVTNAGPSDAPGVTVTDPTPAGLTFVSNSGACATAFPCALGNVPVGATRTITATFRVGSGYSGADPIVNTASVSVGGTDPVAANNSATASTPLGPASADVAVTKSGPAGVVLGTNLVYTIAVTNTGPSDATGVALADPTPTGLTFVSATAPCAAGFPCALGTIAAGATVNLTVTYQVPAGYSGPDPIVNTATASSPTADPNGANNAASASTPIIVTADLGVTMSDGVASATPGTVLTYAIVVTNAGPSAVFGAAVSDPAPAQLLGVTWTCTPVTAGASCGDAGGSGSLATTVDLPAGGIANLSLSGTVAPVSGSITNTVTVAPPASATDPAGGNNSATDVTTINAVDLQLAKTHSGAFTLGTTGAYTLTVTNVGNVATSDSVFLIDSLPAGLTFSAAGGAGWTCAAAGQVVTCNNTSPLAPSSASSVALTVTVQPGVAALVTNVARVATTGDVGAGNDRATDSTAITSVNLALAKRHTGSFVVGQTGLYTLTVRNVGTAPTFGSITLTDTLPNGLTFVSGTGPAWTCAAAGQVVTCGSPGPLAAGDSSAVALTVGVGLAALPQVTNAALVVTPGDTTAADDAATDVPTIIVGTANLAADKEASRGEVEIGDQIEYTVRVRNNDVSPAPDVTVSDQLPVGFFYVRGSARLDGAPAADPAGGLGPRLVFTVDTLAGGMTATLTYRVRVGPGAALGDGINRAQASTSLGPSTSNVAAVRVRLVGGVFTDEGIIVGKVFLDCDCDTARVQGPEELGVPGVRVYLEDGTSTVTDVEGKYSFYGVSPRLHIVKVDQATLPAGSALRLISNRQAGDAGSRFVDVQLGELHRADFAVHRTPETLAATQTRRDAGEIVQGAIPAAGAGRDTLPLGPDSLGDVYRGVLPLRTLTQDNSNLPPLPDAALLPSLAIGRRGAIAIQAPLDGVPADGNTLVPVQLRLLDGTGVALTERTTVTLEASAGRWQVEDEDPVAPGIQTTVIDGARQLFLVAAAQAGQAQVRVSGNGLSGTATLVFVPARRALLAAGVVAGRIDLRSRSLPSSWARDRFEAELRSLALQNAGERLRAGTRAAVFVQGTLANDLGVTLRLDTERDRGGRLFRDIRPDEFYPVYGDASIKDFAAQSTSRLYLRLERARSYFLFGDYATTPATEVRMLGAYSRSLNGALQHVENGRLVGNVFATRGRESQVVDEFAAQGTSGPFVLTQRSGLTNSERVEIVTRDRNQPAVILKADLLARFADYTIEPFTGRLLLRAPVPSVDQNLNPLSVRVTYEVEQGGTAFWTFGADAQVKATDRVELGGSAVRDDNPLGSRSLLSANTTIRLGARSYLIGEFAHADSAGALSGDAARFELRHFADRWEARLSGLNVGTDFANPSAALGRGRSELALRGAAILDRRTRLMVEALRSEDLATGFVRSGAQLGVERQLTDRLRLELGVRHAEDTAATNSLRLRLTGQVAPRASVFGELEQDLAASDQRRALLGGDYRFAERARLYARHELISSFAGPYALNGAQRQNTTVIGLNADYLRDASVFSEYRARDAFSGREAEAAIGLRNRWTLAPGLRFNTSFERVSPLAGAGSGEATAVTGALEYTEDARWRGSARLEYRHAAAGDGWLATLGYGRKMSRDWTLLGRSVYSALAGGELHERSQIGVAFRQTDVNRWSALARYEHKYDRLMPAGGLGTSDEAHVLSSHVNFQPVRQWTFSGELAAKFAATHAELLALRAVRDINEQWDVGASFRTLATLGQGRRQYGLGLEVGRTVRTNLRVAAGYNFFGFTDRDLVGQHYTDHGVYVTFGFKFDENFLGQLGGRRP